MTDHDHMQRALPPLPDAYFAADFARDVPVYDAGQMRAYAESAIAAALRSKSAQAVPEGWQLVPVTPDTAMLDACGFGANGLKRRMWQLMLAAAPKLEGR